MIPDIDAIVREAKTEALREAVAEWRGGPTGYAPVSLWWLLDRADNIAESAPHEAAAAPESAEQGDDDRGSPQCPHEAVRATCGMPCGCGCTACQRLAAEATR